MAHQNEDGQRPPQSASPDFSALSRESSSTFVASPRSPISAFQFRPGYRRVASVQEDDFPGSDTGPLQREGSGSIKRPKPHGLGIENVGRAKHVSISSIIRTASKSSPSNAPVSMDNLSPDSARLWRESQGPEGHLEDDRQGFPYDGSSPSLYQPDAADSQTASLRGKRASSTWHSIGPDGKFSFLQLHIPTNVSQPPPNEFLCKTKRNVYNNRKNWLAISILILAVYSTVFSGIWVFIAYVKPRYGRRITSSGSLPPATASLLFTFFAKSIELSFVTVFVAFIGQVLSRRAFQRGGKGITIAEMSMRSWIMQPGTMITHGETVRYAAVSVLGVIALTAAFMAMFYTTASDALVTPKLKYGNLQDQVLFGKVATQFANPQYIEGLCQTPISKKVDPEYDTTCIQIQHSGQAFHNYIQYLSLWTDSIDTGNGSSDLSKRIAPVAMLYDNTTIQGSWINVQNMADLSTQYNRIVNNVSMALPHSGVFAAARDPINNIVQPEDLDGQGEYDVQASVPSPAINVLCASMTTEDLVPMVYTQWPFFQVNNTAPNGTNWPNLFGDLIPPVPSWLNKTSVDDLFGFGEKYGRRHPVFSTLPKAYNTVTNVSVLTYTDSMYVLGASPSGSSYMMCSLRASLTPNCSTNYHASMSGGFLKTHCDDPTNKLAYSNSMPDANNGNYSKDWVNVASEWSSALSLNNGIFDGDAAIARLLTQLIPTTPALDTSLPSIAEALAVLAGNTLLLSAISSPFIHTWNYSATVPILSQPQYQSFKAALRTQDYSSGGTQHWQGIFYVVLTLVFLSNLFCLAWFLLHGGLVTDFLEPQNLFALAVNSPPSAALEGSCGGGPEEEQFRMKWLINFDRQREHVFIETKGDTRGVRRKKKDRRAAGLEGGESPVADVYHKLSSKRSSLL